MSNIQLPIIIIHEGSQKKKYERGFRRISEKLHQFYFDQGNSKKKLYGSGNEGKENKNKGKGGKI